MSKPRPDELTKQLQAALAKERPRPWKIVLGALVLSTLLLLLLAWFMVPRPPEMVLQTLALDAVYTPDETPLAHVQLLLPLEEEDITRLRGQNISFQETVKPGEKPNSFVKESDERGQVSVPWRVTPGAPTEFLARYINVKLRQGSLADRGSIYVWPKDAPLLVVDADEALIAEQLDDRAAKKLQDAAKKGWHVVYLAQASGQANDYRSARRWLETQPKLPKGPALGRTQYPSDESAAQARRETLKSLQGRFAGLMAFVAKSAESVRIGQDLGVRTFNVGSDAVPTWTEILLESKE